MTAPLGADALVGRSPGILLARLSSTRTACHLLMAGRALAAWSLVHGLTTILIDQRASFLGASTGEAERHARVGVMALFEGLRDKTV